MPVQSKTWKTIIELVLLILILTGYWSFLAIYKNTSEPLCHKVTVTHSPSIAELWSISDIYMENDIRGRVFLVSAPENRLIFMGKDTISPFTRKVVGIDTLTGRYAWQTEFDGGTIAVMKSIVLVGGVGEVIALDSRDGKIVWRVHVRNNAVDLIVVNNDQVFIHVSGLGYYYVADGKTGEILGKRNGTLAYGEFGVTGVQYSAHIDGNVYAGLANDDHVYWITDIQAISNAAVTSSSIYALSQNGGVYHLDPQTGDPSRIFEFSHVPLQKSIGDDNGDCIHRAYFVVISPEEDRLYVYLGDSAQLFAFELNE